MWRRVKEGLKLNHKSRCLLLFVIFSYLSYLRRTINNKIRNFSLTRSSILLPAGEGENVAIASGL